MLSRLLDRINVPVGRGSWRAAEWCDFEATPASIRRCCQNMLQKQWTHRIPFIQEQSPASTASTHLQTVINKVADVPGLPRLTVVDFCAGGGGPTPIFERLINDERKKKGSTPLEFRLCDLYPNTGAWEGFSKKSEHLSYIADSVDASTPPRRKSLRFTSQSQPESATRIFRLFNLSFHHFDDATAQEVLRSTFKDSDGFAIIELQDRRLGCLAMFFFNVFTSLILTPLWFSFKKNKTQYALTYSGVLPFVLWWDGLASCLRTREFDDFLEIVGKVDKCVGVRAVESAEGGRCVRWGEWTLEYKRVLHTWPFGYVNWITGTKRLERVDSVALARERLGGPSGKETVE
ncbi:hypothetical protein BDV96DRAFT_492478 [Lophiotrema nucula]|uniref:Methyltransferase domain-containing protein n=1 Tax=Lophiotrema nucula TaxID=690887 RepID=A0A6A5Z9L7_9PLEO|nr:hypothetical protein BDV96DRAFT_492478 [Lophiotrema nucula]